MDRYACPLCGRQMHPLKIGGEKMVAVLGDRGTLSADYSVYYGKEPTPVYFRDKQVTLYACELCGFVKMIKENPNE